MKIYKYYAGKIHNMDVRETDKTYVMSEDSLDYDVHKAFGYRIKFRKADNWPVSKIEAVQQATTAKKRERDALHKRVASLNAEIWDLGKMVAGLQ